MDYLPENLEIERIDNHVIKMKRMDGQLDITIKGVPLPNVGGKKYTTSSLSIEFPKGTKVTFDKVYNKITGKVRLTARKTSKIANYRRSN